MPEKKQLCFADGEGEVMGGRLGFTPVPGKGRPSNIDVKGEKGQKQDGRRGEKRGTLALWKFATRVWGKSCPFAPNGAEGEVQGRKRMSPL